MNIILWVLQGFLALHTLAGAVWKLTNPAESAVPSLAAIPPALWLGISIVEIFAAMALVLPAIKNKGFGKLPVFAAEFIAFVMIVYCVVHTLSDVSDRSSLIYWVVVAALASFVSYGRMKLKPLS